MEFSQDYTKPLNANISSLSCFASGIGKIFLMFIEYYRIDLEEDALSIRFVM